MDENQASRTGSAELAAEYANNCLLEPTIWDIKLFFGQWYQAPANEVDWHTAVTIPWLQAKLLAHFLQVNVAVYEAEYGPISVPLTMRPAAQEGPMTPIMHIAKEMHDKFFAELKDASSSQPHIGKVD